MYRSNEGFPVITNMTKLETVLQAPVLNFRNLHSADLRTLVTCECCSLHTFPPYEIIVIDFLNRIKVFLSDLINSFGGAWWPHRI